MLNSLLYVTTAFLRKRSKYPPQSNIYVGVRTYIDKHLTWKEHVEHTYVPSAILTHHELSYKKTLPLASGQSKMLAIR